MAASIPRDEPSPAHGASATSKEEGVSATHSSTDFGQDVMNSIQSISQPVEMSDLTNNPSKETSQSDTHATHVSNEVAPNSNSKSLDESTPTAGEPSTIVPALDNDNVAAVDSGIGPATDKPTAQRTSAAGPQLVITLLLHSTDTRHPYTIDESYLKRRNVNVADNNPTNMTVYTLKELILRDWRSEWESRPTSPTSIRLIHMGQMLDDKAYLKDSRFSNGDTPHVVHMTIKPQEAIDEEDARIAKGGGRDRDGSERSPGCRCLIM